MPHIDFTNKDYFYNPLGSVKLKGETEGGNISIPDCNLSLNASDKELIKFPCDPHETEPYYHGGAFFIKKLKIPSDQGYYRFPSSGTTMNDNRFGNPETQEFVGEYLNLDPSELVVPAFNISESCQNIFTQSNTNQQLTIQERDTNNFFSSKNFIFFDYLPRTTSISNPFGTKRGRNIHDQPVFNDSTIQLVTEPHETCFEYNVDRFTTAGQRQLFQKLNDTYPPYHNGGTSSSQDVGTFLLGTDGSRFGGFSSIEWQFNVIRTGINNFKFILRYTQGRDYFNNPNWTTGFSSNWNQYFGYKVDPDWSASYPQDPRTFSAGALVGGFSSNYNDVSKNGDLLPFPPSCFQTWEVDVTRDQLLEKKDIPLHHIAGKSVGINYFGTSDLAFNLNEFAVPYKDAYDQLGCNQ